MGLDRQRRPSKAREAAHSSLHGLLVFLEGPPKFEFGGGHMPFSKFKLLGTQSVAIQTVFPRLPKLRLASRHSSRKNPTASQPPACSPPKRHEAISVVETRQGAELAAQVMFQSAQQGFTEAPQDIRVQGYINPLDMDATFVEAHQVIIEFAKVRFATSGNIENPGSLLLQQMALTSTRHALPSSCSCPGSHGGGESAPMRGSENAPRKP